MSIIEEVSPKIAFVSGGSKGIGLASAYKLKEDGFFVVIGSRTDPSLTDFPWVHLDVASTSSVKAAVSKVLEEYGPISVLVSSAGVLNDKLLVRMSDEDLTSVIDTNLLGSIRLAREVTPSMMRNRYGRIIFISSIAAFYGAPGQVNYSASKAGLIGAARSLAREVGARNITVNVIAPGFVHSDMTSHLSEDYVNAIKSQVPLKKLADPSDIAPVVSFLASSDGSYITGAIIPVDGGLAMGL